MPSRTNIKKRCLNCNTVGHVYRDCPEPLTSYGILLFCRPQINSRHATTDTDTTSVSTTMDADDATTDANDADADDADADDAASTTDTTTADATTMDADDDAIRYLMICRRHTFGFVEFIRANFDIQNTAYIRQLYTEMTCEERERIRSHRFNELWENLWLNRRDHDKYYREFLKSRTNFEKLCATPCFQELQESRSTAPEWLTPEWGFPKGKKNWHEENLDCAMREMREETNIHEKGYRILHEFAPIEERFIGTDRRQYRHVYYIAEAQTQIPVCIDEKNIMQVREVGNIQWMSLTDCVKMIRPYNKEKVQMLQSVHKLIRQYCRLLKKRDCAQRESSATPPLPTNQMNDACGQ